MTTQTSAPTYFVSPLLETTVWIADHGLAVPTCVVLDANDGGAFSTDHPLPEATTIRLSVRTTTLTDKLTRDLTELLVGIDGVRPADVDAPKDNCVEVSLLDPDLVNDDLIQWRVNDRLSVTHADRRHAYLTLSRPDNPAGIDWPHIEITAAETWLLVRALVTLQNWQFHLECSFATAATSLRQELQRTLLDGSIER